MRAPLRGLFTLALLAPALALAGPHYVAPRDWGSFIWLSTWLDAGQTYTYETRDLTGTAPDTVLHVLRDRGGVWSQVAVGDDCAGAARSCVTFTAPDSGLYRVWGRAYADGRGGTASLYRNGVLVLSNQPFGGVPLSFAWNARDTFRATSTTPGAGDHLVFLLRSNTEYLQHDDDSGPRAYPLAVAASTQNAGAQRAVVGRFPGSTGTASFIHDEALWSTIFSDNDEDEDGISNALEPLVGLNPDAKDSDGDGIPDTLELFGNDGFSFSEWGSPTVKDLYVEVDWMEHPTNPYLTRKPYAGLVADAAAVFARDSGVRLHAFIDSALPWHEVVCFGACSGGVDFYALKQSGFSSGSPERRPYFHYAVWAYRQGSGTSCSSGRAEVLGNDLIVSLGCWSSPSLQEQRGTFIHELGHNLALDHNGNEVPGQTSVVHASVMNYRYQMLGVGSPGWHTYSFGANACAACGTSPKSRCVSCRDGFLGCGFPGCGSCDCDVNEWGAVELDFLDDGDADDGTHRAWLARYAPDDKGGPARFQPHVPHAEPSVAARRRSVERKRERLRARGQVEGESFLVSPDGTTLYAECP
ncbi:hypothetical protein [Corallococcus macrosporus]|uniref:Uncharacterized protein n=1 Tax=Myxococcus fulvus (strain ATCC BAA-855 / HW-1) TaxID=483219 RepID=F8C8Y7_MYXFH|nr:hypothetical protein [Corallococcus macrosporus]AEI64487.1 hypothetical protein LILAB_12900 [Corallococcus macrosporus]